MIMPEELILEVKVACEPALTVQGHTRDIVMIPFTGEASGPYFAGKIIGPGVDTQKVPKGGVPALSARYMLEGTDKAGNACRIFIENEGQWGGEFHPLIVTDSALLKDWETAPLRATVQGIPGGVLVRVFMLPQART